MSDFKLPQAAQSGFQSASKYDAHRPSYPSAAVTKFLDALHLTDAQGAKIVEVGAGTGKFTELLVARPEKYEIVAVDPHKGMLEELKGKVQRNGWDGVKVVKGDAEHLDGVEEGWGDCAVVAQAFHWFATKAALEEIHRTLRPGAALGLIWNIEDYNKPQSWKASTPWEQKLNDIMWSLDDGLPRFRHMKWKEPFEEQLETTPLQTIKDTLAGNFPSFSLPLGEDEDKWSVFLSEEALWERISTLSHIAVLEGDRLEEIKSKFREAVSEASKNEKGEVEIHGTTYMAWSSRV